MKEIQLFNFTQAATTNEISKRLDDLSSQLNKSKDKHRKLKDKYKQIKREIYTNDEDSDDEPEQENIPVVPQEVRQAIARKVNMRDAIDYSKFRFQ